MFPSLAKRNLELLNFPALGTPPLLNSLTPGLSPSFFGGFSQSEIEPNFFERSFLQDERTSTPPPSFLLPAASLSSSSFSSSSSTSSSTPSSSSASSTCFYPSSTPPFFSSVIGAARSLSNGAGKFAFLHSPGSLESIPSSGVNRSIVKEFLGAPLLAASIPGSPASFLNADNSEAREGPSAMEELSRSPEVKREVSYSSNSSEVEVEGEVARKKMRREAGYTLNEEEKRQRFLERNRRAAQRCRQKKKDMIERLQRETNELERAYNQLVKEVEATKVLNSFMLSLLGSHKNCTAYVHSG